MYSNRGSDCADEENALMHKDKHVVEVTLEIQRGTFVAIHASIKYNEMKDSTKFLMVYLTVSSSSIQNFRGMMVVFRLS